VGTHVEMSGELGWGFVQIMNFIIIINNVYYVSNIDHKNYNKIIYWRQSSQKNKNKTQQLSFKCGDQWPNKCGVGLKFLYTLFTICKLWMTMFFVPNMDKKCNWGSYEQK